MIGPPDAKSAQSRPIDRSDRADHATGLAHQLQAIRTDCSHCAGDLRRSGARPRSRPRPARPRYDSPGRRQGQRQGQVRPREGRPERQDRTERQRRTSKRSDREGRDRQGQRRAREVRQGPPLAKGQGEGPDRRRQAQGQARKRPGRQAHRQAGQGQDRQGQALKGRAHQGQAGQRQTRQRRPREGQAR